MISDSGTIKLGQTYFWSMHYSTTCILGGMLHQNFYRSLHNCKVLFLKHDLVFERRIYALNYFIQIFWYLLWESGNLIWLVVTLNSKRMKKCMILVYTESSPLMSIRLTFVHIFQQMKKVVVVFCCSQFLFSIQKSIVNFSKNNLYHTCISYWNFSKCWFHQNLLQYLFLF